MTQAQEEAAPSGEPLEFVLRPVREGFSNRLDEGSRGQEVVFQREPEYAGAVHRHALRFGEDAAEFIGMAYDVAAGRLYIDRNRNLDLTDDGPGIASDESDAWLGEFSDVVIEFTHDDVPVHYVLDITIYGGFFYTATVKSGWQGEIELNGKTCVAGISDNMDGVFGTGNTFQFEHERHREARLPFGRSSDVPLPQWLHVDGSNFRLEGAFRQMDEETVVVLTLTPITEDLMPITFEGAFVSRVLLSGRGGAYGMLDWPAGEMHVPAGRYVPERVELLDSFFGRPRGAERLESEGNTLLKVGGPLRQEVTVKRSGAYLSLSYALRGADRTQYEADEEEAPPRFAVYRNGSRVASGQFEYG